MASSFGNDFRDMSSLVDLKMEALCISKRMINCKIFKINRRVNWVAHQIAKFSFENRPDGVLLNSVPPCMGLKL